MDKGLLYLIIGVVGVLVFFAFIYIGMQNNALAKHERVLQRWADIDVALIQRHEHVKQQLNLLGNLVSKESKLQGEIARYRTGITDYVNMNQSQKVDFNSNLGTFISHGLRSENYPELKSLTDITLPILKEWNKVENEIKVNRDQYNRAATLYNQGIWMFPQGHFFKKARAIRNNGIVEPFKLIEAVGEQREAVSIPTPNWQD